MLMSGGDSGQKHIEPMSLDTTYVYEYADVYTVDVVVYLSNPIGENITLTKTFELTWPITDMYLIVSLHTIVRSHCLFTLYIAEYSTGVRVTKVEVKYPRGGNQI